MKQPKALSILFLTEMWERFGFYLLEGLLILFMTHSLDFSDAKSYTILGEFSTLVYITPVVGGYLADKFLGFRFAVLLGGTLLAAGYATLISNALFLGLSLIIIGNGLLKSNISSFLGLFYTGNDERRDSGYTIFYIGINTGVLLSTILGGLLVKYIGWHSTFGVAAVGMLIGIITFRLGFKYFENKGYSPTNPEITTTTQYVLKKPLLLIGIIFSGIVTYIAFQLPTVTNSILAVFGVVLFISLITIAIRLPKIERRNMFALIIIMLFAIVFWGLYLEVFFAVNLFTDRIVDRTMFGFTIPTPAFISLEAIFIIVLGSGIAKVWDKLHNSYKAISAPIKFSVAFLALGVCMQILVFSIYFKHSELIQPLWLVLFYFVLTIAELSLSPVGLSMFSEYSPKHLLGLMMGAWFISVGFGGELSGFLAQQADFTGDASNHLELAKIYSHAFQHFAWLGYASAFLMLIMSPVINKLIKDY